MTLKTRDRSALEMTSEIGSLRQDLTSEFASLRQDLDARLLRSL